MLWVCRGISRTPDTRYGDLYVNYLLPQHSSGDFLFTEVVSPTPRSSLTPPGRIPSARLY